MALLDDIFTILTAAGVINGTTWRGFIGYTPDIGDQAVSLTLTGGYGQDTLRGENVRPTFQVRVRASRLDHAACEAKWWEVFAALNGVDLSVYDIYLCDAQSTGPMTYLDAANRVNMTLNFAVTMLSPVFAESSPD